jgi:hypothetical protein
MHSGIQKRLSLTGIFLLVLHVFIIAQQPSSIRSTQLAPQEDAVGIFTKWELGLNIPQAYEDQVFQFLNGRSGGINPYDPDQIDLRVKLTKPDGKSVTRYAFYYADFTTSLELNSRNPQQNKNEYIPTKTNQPWRFRFAPDQLGEWKFEFELLISGKTVLRQEGSSFQCIQSQHKGNLVIDPGERYLRYSNSAEPFFAIGENISSGGPCSYLPSQHQRQMNALQELIDVGGNFTRFELGAQSALPDWPVHDNYHTKQDEMFAFDKLVDHCEQNDVYFILFRHHVEAVEGADWMDIRWANNPYHKAFNIPILGYFTNEQVKKAQEKTLRYIYARWGYSTNMSFYGYSEVDYWYSKLQLDIENGALPVRYSREYKAKRQPEPYAGSVMKKWLEQQQEYIKRELKEDALFCHTYASVGMMEDHVSTSFFSISDVVGLHLYGENKNINFGKRAPFQDEYRKKYNKPVFIEEMGISNIGLYCCTGIEFHNSIWSTAMMGSFGVGLDWWWDRGVHDFGYYRDLRHLQLFFENEQLKAKKYEPQRWSDTGRSFKKRQLESYALVSEDGERALGWIHNATYYWRNLTDNTCITNLIDGKSTENKPCHVATDPYAFDPSDRKYDCLPRTYHDMYNAEVENLRDFGKGEFTDHFTFKGGARTVGGNDIEKNPSFEIKGLMKSGLGKKKKEWYRIEFFGTSGNMDPTTAISAYTQELGTNNSGKLKIHIPQLDANQTDLGYKVTYLGRR